MHPLLSSLMSDTWAMDPAHLERFLASMEAASFPSAMPSEPDDVGVPYSVNRGVAVIPVSGVLMKSVPPILRMFGIDATGYREIGQAAAMANADPAVHSIMFAIDSPGGSTSGVQALADQIHDIGKPTSAHIETLGASAAYWLASQTGNVTASRGAAVGSIGVYAVVRDTSQAHAAAGVKVHVVASGAHKGAGVPGAAITDEQMTEIRRSVDEQAAGFVADIARGRGMDAVAISPHADGRVFSAADAQARGLIDSVTSNPMEAIHMLKSLEQAAALAEKNPAHAALILQLAAKDHSEDQIVAAISAKNAEIESAKAKAEADALSAKLADLSAKLAAADAKAVVDAAAIKDATDKLAALTAHAEAGKSASKIKSDDAEPARLSLDAFAALSPEQRASAVKDGTAPAYNK